mgnify:CR=1 FL=1
MTAKHILISKTWGGRKKALAIKPDFGKAWSNLGVAYASIGKIEQAEQPFLNACQHEPASKMNWIDLAKLHHATVMKCTRAPMPNSLLRKLVVTPDMHRVHHSVERHEVNRNFGFCLSVWDRLFRLYKERPDAGHEGMTIGQTDWRGAGDQAPLPLLMQPLKSPGRQSSTGRGASGS